MIALSKTSSIILTAALLSAMLGGCRKTPTDQTGAAGTSGTTLATVVTKLMNAASLIPRSTRKCTAHSKTDAPITAAGVLPSPKIGKK